MFFCRCISVEQLDKCYDELRQIFDSSTQDSYKYEMEMDIQYGMRHGEITKQEISTQKKDPKEFFDANYELYNFVEFVLALCQKCNLEIVSNIHGYVCEHERISKKQLKVLQRVYKTLDEEIENEWVSME